MTVPNRINIPNISGLHSTDYERASARILGRDVGRLLTDTSRQIIARVLSQELDLLGATALAMAMIRKEGG